MSLSSDQRRRLEHWLAPAGLVAGLALWYLSTNVLGVPAYILPSPLVVGHALYVGFAHGPFDTSGFWYHSGVTLWEATLGFILGSLSGIVIGLMIGEWRILEKLTYPYLVAFQALPKVAIAPLLVIWFGFGLDGKIVITAVMTFFPLMVNTITGYQSVDKDRLDLARSCNATKLQILQKIVLPSTMPLIFAGLNVASVLAILGAIVGEFVGAQAGLGMLLMQYDQQMEVGSLFAVLIVLCLIGYAMNAIIRYAERRICFWAQRSRQLAAE